MKSILKFIGLTVVTLGLYLVWLVLKGMFNLITKPFRNKLPKLPKDWRFYGHYIIKSRKELRSSDKKTFVDEIRSVYPDLTDKEVDILFSDVTYHGLCRLGVNRSEFDFSHKDLSECSVIQFYHRKSKKCCGGDYIGRCGCGVELDIEDLKKPDRLITNPEAWSCSLYEV